MSETTDNPWKAAAIFLLASLIGVYALYEWYNDKLSAEIRDLEGQLRTAALEQRGAAAKQQALGDQVAALQAQIAALEGDQHADEQALAAQVAALEQEKAVFAAKLEQEQAAFAAQLAQEQAAFETKFAEQRKAHIAELAAERRTAAAFLGEKQVLTTACSELRNNYEAAKRKATDLQADLSRVQETIAKTAAEHQEKIAALEHHLNERVELARTTPLDAELVRAAQALGVLPAADGKNADAPDTDTLAQQLAATQSQLASLQAEHDKAQQQLAQALTGEPATTAARDDQMATERLVREQLQQQHEAAIEALRTRLSAAEQERGQLQQQLAAARAETATADEQTATAAAAAEQAAALRAQLASERSAAESSLAAVRAELETARSEAARLTQAVQALRATDDAAAATVADDLAGANEQIKTLQADLAAARAAAETARVAVTAELATARDQLAAAEAELDQARAELATRTGDQAQALQQAESRIAELENQVREQGDALVAANTTAADELSRLRTLYADFAKLGGTHTERGLLLRLAEDELRFPAGEARLPAGELASLDRIAGLLARQPQLKARIEGHTDSLGPAELNLALSEQRAQAVSAALAARGIAADRMRVAGLGADRPIADNATAAGRSQNRRVEIYVED